MENVFLTDEKIHNILSIARFAPSVHNSQPWLVENKGTRLVILLDRNHALPASDPTGRQVTISLGIFLEAISIAASTVNLSFANVVLQQNSVEINFKKASPKRNSDQTKELVNLLKSRSSDRSIYSPIEVKQRIVSEVQGLTTPDVNVHLITDRSFIRVVAQLTAQGISLALSSPKFRHELKEYLIVPWSKKRRGIAVQSLYLSPLIAVLQPWFIEKGIGLAAESNLERKRWESASGIVIITGRGDMPEYWLKAGRSYLRTSLIIEREGLSQATSAAIVEASNFHEDIEALLGTRQRILAVLRIGGGSHRRYFSPRLSSAEIIKKR